MIMKNNRRTIKLLYVISFVLINLISMQVSTQASVKTLPKSLQPFDKGFYNRNNSAQSKKKKTRPKPPKTGTPKSNSSSVTTTAPRLWGKKEARRSR